MPSFQDNLETLEEMAATLAHEIKNPLALALANLDLIKVSDIGGKCKKYTDIIEHELYTINQLVLDLIHITLSDEREELFDLTSLLDGLVGEYQRRYESVAFSHKPGQPPVFVWGLAKNIRMVFTNLLNNAIEAIPHNGIIEINQEVIGDVIHITISDNGVGLPKDMLLQSNDELYTTKENGTGVGLRFCRSAIAKQGGQFQLQNRPEGGCVAAVILPVKYI